LTLTKNYHRLGTDLIAFSWRVSLMRLDVPDPAGFFVQMVGRRIAQRNRAEFLDFHGARVVGPAIAARRCWLDSHQREEQRGLVLSETAYFFGIGAWRRCRLRRTEPKPTRAPFQI